MLNKSNSDPCPPKVKSKRADINRSEVIDAIKTILLWIGEDPDREGLKETPARVLKSLGEYFSGYSVNPLEVLEKTFSEVEGYNGMVLLKDIDVTSHCEHHLAPIIGKATIAYVPKERVVGISKLARITEVYTKRLQLQERLTAQIANAINTALSPKGVAVTIRAKHHCLSRRGVRHQEADMQTNVMLGCFEREASWREQFLEALSS